jgi:hypothetical protein
MYYFRRKILLLIRLRKNSRDVQRDINSVSIYLIVHKCGREGGSKASSYF